MIYKAPTSIKNQGASSGGARTSRQPGHFQISTVVRLVISCELCEGPKVKRLCGWSVSQGASQGRSFLARAFDLACPGVAPPLGASQLLLNANTKSYMAYQMAPFPTNFELPVTKVSRYGTIQSEISQKWAIVGANRSANSKSYMVSLMAPLSMILSDL